MAKSKPFGYTPPKVERTESADAFRDGEIVRCLLLDMSYPMGYLKDLEARNACNRDDASEIGVPYEDEKPTFKEGGICWKVAIVARSKDLPEPGYSAIPTNEAGGYMLPDYNIFMYLNYLTPAQVKKSGWNTQQKGGDESAVGGHPKIIDLLPNASVCKDWDTGVTADNVPEGAEAQFQKLLQDEKLRVAQWDDALKYWEGLSEEDALAALQDGFARKYFLCDDSGTDEDYFYRTPKVGMTFTCKISKRSTDKGTFYDLKPYEWVKKEQSETGKGYYKIYSDCRVSEPKEAFVSAAKVLQALHEAEKAARLAADQERKAELTPDETNEPGF